MKSTSRNHGAAFKSSSGLRRVQGRQDAGGVGDTIWCSSHPGHGMEAAVQARAVDVSGGTKSTSDAPNLTVLHAKIG